MSNIPLSMEKFHPVYIPKGLLSARGGRDPENAGYFRPAPSLFQDGGMTDISIDAIKKTNFLLKMGYIYYSLKLIIKKVRSMRSHFLVSLVGGTILLFAASSTRAQPSWQLLGLSDRSINCILADDTTMILAGTDRGMSLYWNRTWYDFSVRFPVTSILRLSSAVIFIGAGNGSMSDAVYIGVNIINGPPFYALRFQQYFLEPTAMALNNSTGIPRLYVGGRNIVSVGMIGSDTLYPLQLLKIPPYAFGVENPKCADLFMFGGATLYAGGYDRGVMAGPGSLLRLSVDSLQTIRRLDVSVLAQGAFTGGTGIQQRLVIGTRDTGVLLFEPVGQTWTAIPSQNRQPVNDLIIIPGSGVPSMIIAAFDSGVYINNGLIQTWSEVGNIPALPQCITPRGTITGGMLSGALLAGTPKGVYIYALPTGIRERASPFNTVQPADPIVCMNGEVRFLLPKCFYGGRVDIAVYSASGRLYKRVAVSSEAPSFRLEARGLYYYKIAQKKTAFSGIIVNTQ